MRDLGEFLSFLALSSPNVRVYILFTMSPSLGICPLALRGYINQKGPRCGYKFGYMMYKLTNSAINNEELTKIARDEIDILGRKLNETAILSCIKNDKRVVLYNTVPDRELIVRTNVDKSIYSANTGRVIIANYTPAHLEKCLIRQGMS